MDRGADINALDVFNRNPIYYACWRNHLNLARYLHSRGADIEICDIDGNSIRDAARDWGHDEIVGFLDECKSVVYC